MMCTVYFYHNGDNETKEGILLPLPCSPVSIKLIVEYSETGQILNCYNPNDI